MKKTLLILFVITLIFGCTNDVINDYDVTKDYELVYESSYVDNDISGLYLLDNVIVEFNDSYCSYQGIRSDYSIIEGVIKFSNYNFTLNGGTLIINENSITIGNSELLRIM